MKDAFKKYLINLGIKAYSDSGRPSTVYNYLKRIDNVCAWENTDWEGLAKRIDTIRPEYETYGSKGQLGAKYNNAVLNALKHYEKFVSLSQHAPSAQKGRVFVNEDIPQSPVREVFFQSSHSTASIEGYLSNYATYDAFEAAFSDEFLNNDCRLGNYLSRLLWKYDVSGSHISEQAGVSTNYINEIINKNMRPTRNKLIRIALTIHTTVDEAQHLLRYAGYDPLYVRRKRDVIVWFGLSKGENLETVNTNITNRGLSSLYNEY